MMAVPFWVALGAMTLAGAAVTTQTTINARLAQVVGDGLMAGLISFGVGFSILLLIAFVRGAMPSPVQLQEVPWWLWIGGVCGVWIVCSGALSLPVLGAVTALSALVFGQMVAGLLYDAVGAFGVQVREISMTRIAAVLLVMAGLALSRA